MDLLVFVVKSVWRFLDQRHITHMYDFLRNYQKYGLEYLNIPTVRHFVQKEVPIQENWKLIQRPIDINALYVTNALRRRAI